MRPIRPTSLLRPAAAVLLAAVCSAAAAPPAGGKADAPAPAAQPGPAASVAEPVPPKIAAMLKNRVTASFAAFQRRDAAAIQAEMYPGLTAFLGGREKALGIIQSRLDGMVEDGKAVEACSVEPPLRWMRGPKETIALVPVSVTVISPEERLTQGTCLLAVRDEAAGTWSFLDAYALGGLLVKLAGLKLPAGLDVPPEPEPIVEKLPPAAPPGQPDAKAAPGKRTPAKNAATKKKP